MSREREAELLAELVEEREKTRQEEGETKDYLGELIDRWADAVAKYERKDLAKKAGVEIYFWLERYIEDGKIDHKSDPRYEGLVRDMMIEAFGFDYDKMVQHG